MMANPHALIEGVIISAYAINSHQAFIYVRGEVLHVIRRLRHAVAEAYEAGLLGKDILGSGFDLDVVVHAGAGAFTSAVRRPPCWTRSRATAASLASSRRSPPSQVCTPHPPW